MHRKLLLAICCIPIFGCAEKSPPSNPQRTANAQPQKLDVKHLPNAYRLHEKVISGGLPEGDEAFAELASLGVKTVISVDGAKPDVERARKYGMRYVHLPHGYDGVPDQRAKELAKAVRFFEGPIFIHCHHGKHRSPAAAAVACVGAGFLSPDQAVAVLKTAGTSDNYRGLYLSAQSARRIDDVAIDQLPADFPETAKLPALAEAMIDVERHHDHLKTFAAAKWQKLPKHPDLDPAHEALLLRESFTELLRTDDAKSQPQKFQKLLRESEAAANELEATLRGQAIENVATSKHSASELFTRMTNNCQTCHKEFRDVPLGEKKR